MILSFTGFFSFSILLSVERLRLPIHFQKVKFMLDKAMYGVSLFFWVKKCLRRAERFCIACKFVDVLVASTVYGGTFSIYTQGNLKQYKKWAFRSVGVKKKYQKRGNMHANDVENYFLQFSFLNIRQIANIKNQSSEITRVLR